MGFDQLRETGNDVRIKCLVEPGRMKKVPGMDHQINQTKPLEGSRCDIAFRTGDRLFRRGRGERFCLTTCGLDHGSDRIIPELIPRHKFTGRIAINAGHQERGEAVAHHYVLDQLAHRDVRRRGPIPRVRRESTHDPDELGRRRLDQLHARRLTGTGRGLARCHRPQKNGPVTGSGGPRLAGISLDCPDPAELISFYVDLLGGQRLWDKPGSSGARIDGTVLIAQRVVPYVRPSWPGTSIVHLDLSAAELDEATARAKNLGAVEVQPQPDSRWRVLLDPAGHPFCITTVTSD
jgi:Glyoxalase-like domain